MKVLKAIILSILALVGLVVIAILANLDAFKEGYERGLAQHSEGLEQHSATELASMMAEQLNALMPVEVDEHTKAVAVTSEDDTVIYTYTIAIESWDEAYIDELRMELVSNACTKLNPRKVIDQGVRIRHVYKTEHDSRPITTIGIGREDCSSEK